MHVHARAVEPQCGIKLGRPLMRGSRLTKNVHTHLHVHFTVSASRACGEGDLLVAPSLRLLNLYTQRPRVRRLGLVTQAWMCLQRLRSGLVSGESCDCVLCSTDRYESCSRWAIWPKGQYGCFCVPPSLLWGRFGDRRQRGPEAVISMWPVRLIRRCGG